MAKPLTLTIVIPVYNEEAHLRACLEAIAMQTVKPDEVIIVDNNSTDASREIAESFPFVKVISEKKQGIAFARDAGFNAARTDIIGRIDGDTVMPPNWARDVKKFYSVESHQNQALTGGGYFYNIRAPRINSWVVSQLGYRMNRTIIGFYVTWGSNMAMPRSMWQAVRDDTCHTNDIHEDLDLAIHLHRDGYAINYKAGLKVGVHLKRVWENRNKQNEHLARWPRTLKTHGYRYWWLSLAGNGILKFIMQPLIFVAEGLSSLFGRPKLGPKV